jgi:copper chaperone NosL
MLPTPVLRLELIDYHSSIGFSHFLRRVGYYSLLICLSAIPFACSEAPEPINYGKDECEHCRMMITDNKYGSEIMTNKGKVYKFDSIECLIEYALEKNLLGDDNQMFLVTDFSMPEKLIDAKSAFYAHNDDFRSPMGFNVSAFGSQSEFKNFLSKNGGRKLSWLEVIEMVKQNSM